MLIYTTSPPPLIKKKSIYPFIIKKETLNRKIAWKLFFRLIDIYITHQAGIK